MKLSKTLLFASCSALLLAGSASAANVIWQATQGITSSNDVDTSGTLFTAVSATGADITVNGVNFLNAPSNYTDTFNNTNPSAFINPGSFSGPDAANYKTLLGAARLLSPDANTAVTLTFSGLTVGNGYLVQYWVSDFRADYPDLDRTLELLGGVNNSGALKYLDSNLSNTTGGPARQGTYVIGTFTADASTQNLGVINANQSTQMNALQLREIVAVPEPSAAILGGVSLLALLRRRRA